MAAPVLSVSQSIDSFSFFVVDFIHVVATIAPVLNLLLGFERANFAVVNGIISVCDRSSAFDLFAVLKLCGDSDDERFNAGSLIKMNKKVKKKISHSASKPKMVAICWNSQINQSIAR